MSEKRNVSFISNKDFRDSKDPLHKYFDWDSAPGFMQKWNEDPKMKAFAEDVIRNLSMNPREQKKFLRPDPITQAYRENYQYLQNTFPRLNANPTGLTIDQILGQDRHFHRTYVNNNIMAQILARVPGVTRVMEGKQWELKHHKLTNYGWPVFTRTFKNLGVIEVGPEGVKSEGYGWGAEYEIPFTTLDMAQNGIYDIDYWHVFMLSQQMGIFGDQRLALGGLGENTTGAGANNLYGLHNWYDGANSASSMTGIGSAGICTQGKADWDEFFQVGLTTMHDNKVFAPGTQNIAITTSGPAAEQFVNDSTVGALKTCYQQIQDKWFKSGDVNAWYVTNNIEKDTHAVSTNRLMMMKLGPNYIRRTIVYPLQRKAILNKTYSDDVAFAYITGDILQVYDPNAIVINSSDIVTNYKGWTENGLFMDANTTGQRADAIYA